MLWISKKGNQNELDKVIYVLLNKIGMPHNNKGYRYIVYAIKKVMENPKNIELATKLLYPEIAKENGDTWKNVERSIRYSIERCWTKGNTNALNKIFDYTIDIEKGRPTNLEFICCMCDFISIYGEDILNLKYKL